MLLNPLALEAQVRASAPGIAQAVHAVAEQARTEADLIAEIEKVLDRFVRAFDLTLRVERERTLINGRADAVYNRLVIEYEPPGSLQRSNAARPNQHAIEQVQRYIAGLEQVDRQQKERLAGVALDGNYYIFIRYREGSWRIDDPLPVDAHSTETFLHYLLSLSTELALTPDNLRRGFGESTVTARRMVGALYHALVSNGAKIQTLFEQWQRQFREVTGYSESSRLDAGELARAYSIGHTAPDLEQLFFAVHTYYATFIKLLAVQAAHYYVSPQPGDDLAAVADYASDRLQAYLTDMERGGLFARMDLRNFLEGDFFGWYLDAWNEEICAALRRLIADLSNYSLITLDVDPDETRDLLKQLYQNLMPRKLRHALGEYYTPDWLAERLLNQLGYEGDPRERLLDPSCGSGTFLVLALKRARRYAETHRLPPGQALELVLNNIVGFDLNPLAVISARTNYLLALGNWFTQRQGPINLPVYLADSILTPAMETAENGQLSFLDREANMRQPGYSFNTAVGRFSVPRSLVEARSIDALANLLEDCVQNELTPAQFRTALARTFDLTDADTEIAVALYDKLLDLERRRINGIWARIIKNAFAPLFHGRFDYVAGNPPWVNWESLPQNYRLETKPLWIYHNLFPHAGLEAIMGKGKKDISMLLTFVAADSYLYDNGKLGFIITQSVFKTAGSGQGFRNFTLGSGAPVKILAVDDLAELQPFESASNRTAIFVLQRGRKTRYPVAYNVWRKRGGGTRLPEDAPLADILQMCVLHRFVAQPVDAQDITSTWITGKRQSFQALQKVLGKSDYAGRAGVCTWLNGVYWLEVVEHKLGGPLLLVRNKVEGAKKEIEQIRTGLEPDLVYPLLRGRDVSRWCATPQACILVTHEPGRELKAIPEDDMATRLPKTFAYLKQFKKQLLGRSGYRRYFKDSDPFYSMFNIGDYTFAPYKVVWREQASRLTAAVAAGKERCIIPDHKLMLVPFNNQRAAHYLCALLNSSPAQFVTISYAVNIQMDTHILENVRVPRFDPHNAAHQQLARLSQQAHKAAARGEAEQVKAIEAEIDQLAAQVWGLTQAELVEIQQSLAEL